MNLSFIFESLKIMSCTSLPQSSFQSSTKKQEKCGYSLKNDIFSLSTLLSLPFLFFTILLPLKTLHADTTGLLPHCPAPMGMSVGSYNLAITGVFTNPSQYHLPPSWIAVSIGSFISDNFGGPEECASQNWFGTDSQQYDMPKATNSYAEPSEISASSFSKYVTFHVESYDQPGPFDVNFWECFPPANFGDLDCMSDGPSVSNMAYRKANGAGVFTGPWTFITSGNNPGFLLTRLTDCPSPLQELTHPSQGAPCTYRLDFALSPEGVPIMQAPHQVVMFTTAGSHPQTGSGGFTSNDYTSYVTIPLLLTTGSSSSIEADASDFTIISGEETLLSFHLNGNIDPDSLPVLIIESAAPGSSTFSALGEVPTDTNGDVTYPVSPTTDTQYRARLKGTGAGELVVSNNLLIQVEPPENVSADSLVFNFIELARTTISQIKKKAPKTEKEAQKALRAQLRQIASDLYEFISVHLAEISIAKPNFNLTKASKKSKSALRKFAKKKKAKFKIRKKKALKSLKSIENGVGHI